MTTPLVTIANRPREWRIVRIATLTRVALFGLFVGNLGRIPAFSTGDRETAVLLNDLLVALLLCAGAVRIAASRSLRLDRVALFGLAFAAVGGASAVWSMSRFGLSSSDFVVSLGYLARWLFYFGLYVVLVNSIRADDAGELWRTLEIVILAVAIFGIIQSIALPNFAQLVYPDSRPRADWDPQGHRLVSTWLDPVFAGGFIALGILMELAQISVGTRVPRWKPVVLSIALLLTASRASVLAVLVGICVIVFARGLSRRMLKITAAVLFLLLVGAPLVLKFTGLFEKLTIDVSGLQRVVAWMRAWRVFSDNPAVGIGFNTWGFVQEHYGYERQYAFSYSLDGGLIFIALMTGIVGLWLYVSMLWAVLKRARSVWRDRLSEPAHRGLAIGVAAGTVALVVHSLFGNSLFLPFLMETMWLLWAILFAISRSRNSAAAPPRKSSYTHVAQSG